MSAITLAHLRALAATHGLIAVGVTPVQPMDPAPLHAWLAAGYAAEMTYLTRHRDTRGDLARLLAGARSVISVAMPYPVPTLAPELRPFVARFAQGADYHVELRTRLEALWREISTAVPAADARLFVDAGPLPERELARRGGVGWVGRHACLIVPGVGSRVVLGEILTTLALPATPAHEPSCGPCRRCVDACPTGALVRPGVVDARRCLSYLTIEHKGAIPLAMRSALGTALFGCDRCQDLCPWNRDSEADGVGGDSEGQAPQRLVATLAEWFTLSNEEFTARYRSTPLWRAKRRGLLRNACVVLGNLQIADARPILERALHEPDPLLQEHARWGLERCPSL
jgi:epoxyqueuosine reductase